MCKLKLVKSSVFLLPVQSPASLIPKWNCDFVKEKKERRHVFFIFYLNTYLKPEGVFSAARNMTRPVTLWYGKEQPLFETVEASNPDVLISRVQGGYVGYSG